MKSNRILIADDHTIVRSGLQLVAREIIPSAVFDEASDGDEVVVLIKKHEYDLIILDINMPDTDAITLISNILAYTEDSRILIFSMNSEELYAKRYLKMGVLGYITKDARASELRRAISSVLDGKVYMSPTLREHMQKHPKSPPAENPFERLSDREMQIAKYFLLGYSYADIQKILNVHTSTIGTHKMRLFDKLNVKNLFDLNELAKLYQVDLSRL